MLWYPPIPGKPDITELTMLMIMTPIRMTVSVIEAQARMTELIWGNLLNYRERC